jgi:hypothetical protein
LWIFNSLTVPYLSSGHPVSLYISVTPNSSYWHLDGCHCWMSWSPCLAVWVWKGGCAVAHIVKPPALPVLPDPSLPCYVKISSLWSLLHIWYKLLSMHSKTYFFCPHLSHVTHKSILQWDKIVWLTGDGNDFPWLAVWSWIWGRMILHIRDKILLKRIAGETRTKENVRHRT